MRNLRTTFAALLIGASFYAVATPPSAGDVAADEDAVLEGTWEGSFTAMSPTPEGHGISSQVEIRLTLRNESARVFSGQGGAWREVEPGRFKVETLGTNALVYLVHAGRIPKPEGSRWVETYLIAVAARNDGTLLGQWTRVVNHPDVAPGDPDRAFTVAGEVVFRRVGDPGGG